MAKNDYFVIICRVLTYLYSCLKEGEKPCLDYMTPEVFECVPSYWDYILLHLYEDEYITGVSVIPILGEEKKPRILPSIKITPKGIAYLQDNSMMAKARDFLKTLKETLPGI